MTHRRATYRWIGLAAALALLGVFWGWGRRESGLTPGKSGDTRNLLLITVDTLRADRLGCYGHSAARTPTLDALAASGVRFDHAFTHVPMTLPSHAALLTGRYPAATGLRINGAGALTSNLRTLPELCRGKGLRTAAFVSAVVLDSAFGLDRGFDLYGERLSSSADDSSEHLERRGDRTCAAALNWLDAKPDVPFFAWVHFFDPHAPYAPPEEFRGVAPDPYDGEIAFVDAQVHRLVDWLEARHLRERTLVVIVGDHGEGLGEHDEAQHGLFIYNATMQVPLLLSYPSVIPAGRVVQAPVGLVDLLPTLVDLARLESPGLTDGKSLRPLFSSDAVPTRSVYGESYYSLLGFGWSPLRSLTTQRWKYIEAPHEELYDVQADPQELNNLIAEHPDVAAQLRQELQVLAKTMETQDAKPAALDNRTLDRLSGLGYVSAGSTLSAKTAGGVLRDPKEMLPVYEGFLKALAELQREEFQAVVDTLEPLAGQSPESDELLSVLGTAYLRLNRFPQARDAFEASLRMVPDHPRRLTGLAEALRGLERLDDALPWYEKALAVNPNWEPAHRGLASLYSQQGRYAQALPHWQHCVERTPNSPQALANLGAVLVALHRPAEAVPVLRKALTHDPHNEFAHRALWPALEAIGQRAQALESLRAALAVLPDNPAILCPLSRLLATTPRLDRKQRAEAVALAQSCCRVDPQSAKAFDILAAAHAGVGEFPLAAEAARHAVDLAAEQGLVELRRQFERRLQRYVNGLPYEE